ncbi:RNA directed DNA polymerase (reverse transcriptase) [Echinococcus multilocularis]|uniref:RNA directed DNA polymerase (Reverse transcriptase) n=1 Tax=Echinococcus multilocularis TaxID=6211 RepID=A0A0S4MIP2_ECHMU|nr:RNA directed DNA polymerase (reverse transcriptase) [Echinococcus multilocularis]
MPTLTNAVIHWLNSSLFEENKPLPETYFPVSKMPMRATKNLCLLAEHAFLDFPPNKVASWVVVQCRHGVRPPDLAGKLCHEKTNLLGRLAKLAIKKGLKIGQGQHPYIVPPHAIPLGQVSPPIPFPVCSQIAAIPICGSLVSMKDVPVVFFSTVVQLDPLPFHKIAFSRREMLIEGETSLKVCIRKETWTVKFIVCPKLACDVIPGADFLPCTKALQNLAQGTFSTQRATGANADTLLPNDDADDICIAFFEAAAVLMNDLDDPCA